MVDIRKITTEDKNIIPIIAEIHVNTFKGFFLTFLGKGFLKLLYTSFVRFSESDVAVAFDEDVPVGFIAYSENMSGLYKYMIKRKLIPFIWYSFLAFIRRPKVFVRLFRALLKPVETKREDNYVELASIGVIPEKKGCGIGSALINFLKSEVDFTAYKYISLETDAVNNDAVNEFYIKNGFGLSKEFTTREGRIMCEYRYYGNPCS